MADSLLDLSPVNNTVMDFMLDWASEPGTKLEIMINANINPGTIHSILFYRDPVNRLNCRITDINTKLYALLVFFADRVGRLKSFWMPSIFNKFAPLVITDGGQYLEVGKQPSIYLHGHERIFIRLKNGDRISRKIESVTHLTNSTQIEFLTPLPEIEDIADIEFCGLLYYVRFDQDTIDVQYLTDKAASVDLGFVELLEEYDTWPT